MARKKTPKGINPGTIDKYTARRVLRELARREALSNPPFLQEMHEHQRAFIESKAQFKAALCGRRSGKTTMVRKGLLARLRRFPNSTHAYMGLTRDTAKRLMWAQLQQENNEHQLGLRFNKVELIVYSDENGSQLWLLGADKEEDIEKARGPKYTTFAIDEAASYRSFIRYLVREAVEPALGDVRGELWLTGTPGRVPAGYFFDATDGALSRMQGGKFEVHRWDVTGNPYFPEPEEWLAQTREDNGWNEDHPIYRREYLGKWVHDDDALVYKYSKTRNLCHNLPPLPAGEHYRLVLSLDFGVVDPTAFVVLAYSDHSPVVFIVYAHKVYQCTPSTAAERVGELMNRFMELSGADTPKDTFEAMIGDVGGLGKAYAAEFEERHKIWLDPASKMDKYGFIDLLNGELVTSRVMVVEGETEELVDEWTVLPWIEKGGKLRGRYDDRAHDDHASDAALYGFRACRGYMHESRDPVAKEGTPEYKRERERERLEEDLREHGRQDGEFWWEKLM